MDFGDIFRIVIYLWLAVSLSVYGYRAYRRLTSAPADIAPPATEKPASRLPAAKPAPASAKPRKADTGLPRGRALRGEKTSVPAPSSEGGLVEAVIREELEARKRAGAGATATAGADGDPLSDASDEKGTSAPGRAGLFAPLGQDVRSAEAEAEAEDRPTVADALEGIVLPCDLAPLIGDVDTIDPHRVVFVTSGHGPRLVGSRLADELERLGFVMGTSSETSATATRDDVVVTIVLHEDANIARRAGERLFPSAPGGSVAVELTT